MESLVVDPANTEQVMLAGVVLCADMILRTYGLFKKVPPDLEQTLTAIVDALDERMTELGAEPPAIRVTTPSPV